ncbi:hypothetical protein FA95DRAFT_1455736, partial [Auriscalpium vulgare]
VNTELTLIRAWTNFRPDFPLTIRVVPKWHLLGHKDDCKFLNSPDVTPGCGMTEGEAPERRWAVQNSLGYRHDTHNVHNGDFNMQKIFTIG